MVAQPGHIQFTDVELADQIRKRCHRSSESSGHVASRMLKRYLLGCNTALPCLRWEEWSAIFYTFNDTWRGEEWNPRYISTEVHDKKDLGEKFNIDQDALVQYLMQASYATCLAIVDAAERFSSWKNNDLPINDWHSTVIRIVGKDHVKK